MIPPQMLTLSDVSKAYGGKTLFAAVNVQVNPRDRIGLVGPNGAGKTTLFSMVLGRESPDLGQIIKERGMSLGHLPQESAPVQNETVLELACAVSSEIARLQKLIKGLDAGELSLEGIDLDEHGSPHAHFAELGGHQLEARAKKILAGLSFREKDFDRPAREMSGGWVMRAHLARLLVQEPDLLMLDEPTNHLDLEALIWFQNYLKKYPGAILVISHDREFLNQLVDSIVEIRQSRLFRYRGNYDEYLVQREAQGIQHQAAFDNQQREINRLMEFVNRFRAKNTKAAQAQSKLKQIERMEKIEAPINDAREISFQFPQPARSGLKVATLRNIRHAYGDLVVYHDMAFQAERGQRIVLVGPNGAGKSTLLKLLAGVLPVQSGERKLGHNVNAGYFSQYRADILHPDWTVLEEALETPQRITEEFARTLLGSFLFQGDDVFKRVKVLSGGEKSRLALVKILLDPPNLLLMDEPTTHLDMSSIDALLAALDQFEGTIIFISHDVYFIRSLANRVVHVHAGTLTEYPGGYDYFLDKTQAASERHALTAAAPGKRAEENAEKRPTGAKTRDQKRLEAEKRQERHRRRQDQRGKVERLEGKILELEKRQAELTNQLQSPDTYSQPGQAREINLELAELSRSLQEFNARWETEATRLSEL